LILVIALLLVLITFSGCGSQQNGQPAQELPPPIPAAEPVLLYNGTGASSSDVSAIKAVLSTQGIGYATADSSELNAMNEAQLGGYKLIIVPGGNSIMIGQSLTTQTTSAIRGAVIKYGTHYLGICAGAFFGGSSTYNGVNLTGGVSFNFYADENLGIHLAAVEISFPSGTPLDIYWQDGPQFSGWGEIVGKYPDGTPAIVEGNVGKGFVILSGVHPEAPANWRSGMTFKTSLATDLAYAGTLIDAALNAKTLPHF